MLNRRRSRFAAAAAAVCCVVAGVAYAAGGIPGADGVIQGCYDAGGNLKVVASLPCPKGYTALSWNQAGPQGLKGDKGEPGATGQAGKDGSNGVSPTVSQLPAGDSHCAAGGAAITDAAGSTAYVCSGQDGQSFAGTFTSPNGQFSLEVTDAGVEITGPDSTITLPSGGGVDIMSDGALSISSGGALSVRSGGATSVVTGGAMSVTVGTTLTTRANDELHHVNNNMDVEVVHDETHFAGHDRITTIDHDDTYHSRHDRTEAVDNDQTISIHRNQAERVDGTSSRESGGTLSVKGSSVKINDSSCQPAARVGDQVASTTISTGSGTVCIGG